MSVSLIVTLSNLLFWLLWIVVELRRRRRGAMPEMPLCVILIILSLNTLLFDSVILFRIGAFAALIVAIYEAREIVQRGAPELALAGAVVSGAYGAMVLTYWAVIVINEHLNLTLG